MDITVKELQAFIGAITSRRLKQSTDQRPPEKTWSS